MINSAKNYCNKKEKEKEENETLKVLVFLTNNEIVFMEVNGGKFDWPVNGSFSGEMACIIFRKMHKIIS